MVKFDFIKLIIEHQKYDEKISKLASLFGIEDVWEIDLFNYGYNLFNKILDYTFNEEGNDIIYWYLYENFTNEECPMCNKTIKSADELWEIVKTKQK